MTMPLPGALRTFVFALVLVSAGLLSTACSDKKSLVIAEVTVEAAEPLPGPLQIVLVVKNTSRTFTVDKGLSMTVPERLGVRVDSGVTGMVTVTATTIALGGGACFKKVGMATIGSAGDTVSVKLPLAEAPCDGGDDGGSGSDGGDAAGDTASGTGGSGGTGAGGMGTGGTAAGGTGAGGSGTGGQSATGGGTATGGMTGTGGGAGSGDDGGARDATPEVMPPSNPPSLASCLEFDHGALTCNLDTGVGNWALWSVVFSPDGKLLLSGGEDNRIKFWRVEDKTLVADTKVLFTKGTTPNHLRLAFSPDGKYVAAGNNTGDLRIFEAGTWIVYADLPAGHTTRIAGVQFSPDSSKLLSIADDGLRSWSVASKSALSARTLPGKAHSLGTSPAAGATWWVAVGMDNGQVAVLDANAASPVVTSVVVTTAANDLSVSAVGWSPDGQLLAAGGTEGTLWLFNAADKTAISKIATPLVATPFQDVNGIAFFPSGRHVGAAIWGFNTAGQVGIWDVTTRAQRSMLGGTRGPVSIAISPDGGGVAFGNWSCAKVTYCRD